MKEIAGARRMALKHGAHMEKHVALARKRQKPDFDLSGDEGDGDAIDLNTVLSPRTSRFVLLPRRREASRA